MAVILSPYQNRYQYNSYAVSKNINRPDSGGTVAGDRQWRGTDSGGGQTECYPFWDQHIEFHETSTKLLNRALDPALTNSCDKSASRFCSILWRHRRNVTLASTTDPANRPKIYSSYMPQIS